MKVTRFHATADGESRFQEIEVPINERRPDQFGHTILQSGAWASPSIRFVELPVGLDQSWHHAPARQIVVVLSGEIEVVTSDNQKRRCTPGQAFYRRRSDRQRSRHASGERTRARDVRAIARHFRFRPLGAVSAAWRHGRAREEKGHETLKHLR